MSVDHLLCLLSEYPPITGELELCTKNCVRIKSTETDVLISIHKILFHLFLTLNLCHASADAFFIPFEVTYFLNDHLLHSKSDYGQFLKKIATSI